MKTALVTGANGFTGSYLCKQLIENGYQVRGLVRTSSDLILLQGIPVELAYADLAVDNRFSDIMNGIDTVYHIAAIYRNENVSRKYFWDVNVGGTRKLLDAAVSSNVRRFVHCSTVGVQGHIKNPPATEDFPYDPGDHYQESKLEAELLAMDYFRQKKLNGVVVRPSGIYGPGDTRFLKLFRHIQNGSFRMIGTGKTYYHMTYVEDVAEGFVHAGETRDAAGEIFTIGGEEYVTLQELVNRIARVLNTSVSRIRIPAQPVWLAAWLCERICRPFGISPPIYPRRVDFFIKSRAFDISKAKNILGYHPRVNLDDGLRRTAEWYRQQGLLV
ncbi:MAG: NAD-dependent epimerase/dehydratase family protein [Desulfatirhabdiaceae bacterium]